MTVVCQLDCSSEFSALRVDDGFVSDNHCDGVLHLSFATVAQECEPLDGIAVIEVVVDALDAVATQYEPPVSVATNHGLAGSSHEHVQFKEWRRLPQLRKRAVDLMCGFYGCILAEILNTGSTPGLKLLV